MKIATTIDKLHASARPGYDHRHNDSAALMLVQLDPASVVDGVPVENGYLAGDILVSGAVRETCPVCKTVHLKLVLRQKYVKRAHMLCEQCTRCFDARYPDGSPAFANA